jgi:hypothetical protein
MVVQVLIQTLLVHQLVEEVAVLALLFLVLVTEQMEEEIQEVTLARTTLEAVAVEDTELMGVEVVKV